MLREDQQEIQQDQNSTQVEVVSGLSSLYPLIEQRRDSLPRDLNNLESDSDQSMIEDDMHNDPADVYGSSLSSAQIPRRGSNDRF